MFVGQSSFILEGRKVALAERRRHNDWLMWSYDLMFANYYDSKFAWRLTLSLDLFSCYLNSSAQRRLPDFTATTRLSDKFRMADVAEDATVTRFSKWEEEYSIEDVDRLAFLRIMTSSRSLGCCKRKEMANHIQNQGLLGMMSWCLMSSDVIWHIRDKLWPMPKHGSIKSTYVRCMRV